MQERYCLTMLNDPKVKGPVSVPGLNSDPSTLVLKFPISESYAQQINSLYENMNIFSDKCNQH